MRRQERPISTQDTIRLGGWKVVHREVCVNYVNLGKAGVKVSRLCLGMMSYGTPEWRDWVLSEKDSQPFIRRALDAGINFFDTADAYSHGVSEVVLGHALKAMTARDQVVIATKVFNPSGPGPNDRGLSRRHILQAIDASLSRLGVDYVDLYQIHRWDSSTPIEETMSALHDVVKSGKALYLGASSMHVWQFAKAQEVARTNGWTPFVSMQNHYNLVYREEEREMIPLCLDQGVGLIPWSPLARGFLAGNRTRDKSGPTARSRSDDFAHDLYYADADFDVVDAVKQVAAERGASPAQIALAWLLHKPGVASPIFGATRIEHLEEAVGALEIRLSPEEIAGLEAPYRPHPVLGIG
jgi:aryl-alcohol dehydrogenase-like predicted oxidoreductase